MCCLSVANMRTCAHPKSLRGVTSVSHRRTQCIVAAASLHTVPFTKVALTTLSTCELAVSVYPRFSYKASKGGGFGDIVQLEDGRYKLSFPADKLLIPALSWETASVFGIPIPPPIRIDIQPRKFEGIADLETGQIDMEFDAEFNFTIGPLYAAPPLLVKTVLTTESSSGQIYSEKGKRLHAGNARLVGVARVPKVNEWFVDSFLMLPTDALAVMDAHIKFS